LTVGGPPFPSFPGPGRPNCLQTVPLPSWAVPFHL
jgi:hypothetical protein